MPAVLFAAHEARYAALDPHLPPAAPVPEGEIISAATENGDQVRGVLQRRRYPPDSLELLWCAARTWQLFPFTGGTGTAGMDALLRAWQDVMRREEPGTDSACTVTWPSRDAEAARALLDHGLLPISALAIRTERTPPAPEATAVHVRRARAADFEAVLELAAQAFDYTSLVGSRGRPDTTAMLAPVLRQTLREGGPVWLAERDGELLGLADCGWVDASQGNAAGELLPPGRWGYVNHVTVRAGNRDLGVGRALMAVVHRELGQADVTGSYLYYNPPNPLSSVFWHRQGYRPLWTMWEANPASALR